MSVVLLGGSGFLGSWTTRALIAAGHHPTLLVRPESDLWRLDGLADHVTIVRADAGAWPDAIVQARPEVVVSLDWAGVSGAERDSAAQWKNVERLDQGGQAAVTAGAQRFVGVGSQAEFGPCQGVIAEDTTPQPVTAYGRAKLAARQKVQAGAEAAGMTWAWARVFSTFGALDQDFWLLPTITKAILAGQPVPLSDGGQLWSYLYGADAGNALAMITDSDFVGTVNVGGVDAPPLRQTIERFVSNFDQSAELQFGAVSSAPGQVRHLEPELSRLRGLGWRPAIEQDDALAATAAWFQGQSVADPLLAGLTLPRHRGFAS